MTINTGAQFLEEEPRQDTTTNKGYSFGSMFAIVVLAIVVATIIDFLSAWIPFVWITPLKYVVYTTLVTALLSRFVLARRELRRIVALIVFIVAMVILYNIQWNTRKPFLMDLSRVRIGMTAEEVDGVMSKYIKGSGIPPVGNFASDENGQLKLKDSIVYRHSNDGAFNADWGVVKFKDGKVVDVEFLPD